MANTKITTTGKKSITIVGISDRVSNTPQGFEKIQKLWKKFYSDKIFEKLGFQKIDETIPLYSVYMEYESDEKGEYTLLLGLNTEDIKLTTIPSTFTQKTIPAAHYQVYTYEGLDNIIKTWQNIWSDQDLMRTYTGDFDLIQGNKIQTYVAIK